MYSVISVRRCILSSLIKKNHNNTSRFSFETKDPAITKIPPWENHTSWLSSKQQKFITKSPGKSTIDHHGCALHHLSHQWVFDTMFASSICNTIYRCNFTRSRERRHSGPNCHNNLIITIIIIRSIFLERFSMWNMLNCAEQVQI